MELVVNDYNNLRVRLALSSPVILLTSQSYAVLERFNQTVLKEREQCFLLEGDKHMMQSLADCKVDYIDDEFAKTSLNIEEYLCFYGLANQMFSNTFAKDIESFIKDNHLQKYKDQPLCNLTTLDQLKTRLFITDKRDTRILIVDNNEGAIADDKMEEVIQYFKNFCQQRNMIAIITTRSTAQVQTFTGEVYTL